MFFFVGPDGNVSFMINVGKTEKVNLIMRWMGHINSIENSADRDRKYMYKAMATYGHINVGIAVLQVALERKNKTSEDYTKRMVDIENRWMSRLGTINHG